LALAATSAGSVIMTRIRASGITPACSRVSPPAIQALVTGLAGAQQDRPFRPRGTRIEGD